MLFSSANTLDKSIPVPLYYQLKKIILEYIQVNHKNLDESIPTENEIGEYFNISRPTVRQAINELVVEGYLYRIKSKGTFITKPKIKQGFLATLDNFYSEMNRQGLTPSTKVISVTEIESDKEISDALSLPVQSKVVKLSRLRYADQDPIVLVTTYLPQGKCPDIETKDLENRSLYEVLETDYQYRIASAKRSIESVLATEDKAEALNIKKGSAVQYIESKVYLYDGTPIEYSQAFYRGDRNKFAFEVKSE
ncbi:MAG: GntR family transcriptional regulator [Clostridia bacterium]|jgi:GntR family transcriptional regulator|nr:GntR family transcriptional regulator [Clostridia bacterium]